MLAAKRIHPILVHRGGRLSALKLIPTINELQKPVRPLGKAATSFIGSRAIMEQMPL
jgi:hypothetical protein